jgi:ribosomal protein S18 acetylase RimI-like enzyme
MPHVDFRAASVEDATFLAALFASVKGAELAAAGLPAPLVDQLVNSQADVERRSRAVQYPDAIDRIVVVEGRDVGRLLVDRTVARTLLVDVSLLPDWRGRGIGGALVRTLVDESDATGVPVHLTVRRENPAIRLYRRAGFVVVDEDALDLRMKYAPRVVVSSS